MWIGLHANQLRGPKTDRQTQGEFGSIKLKGMKVTERKRRESLRIEKNEALLVRVRTAAELLSMPPSSVYALVVAGRLPSVRLGARSIRIPIRAIEAMIDQSMNAPQSADTRIHWTLMCPIQFPGPISAFPLRCGAFSREWTKHGPSNKREEADEAVL